MRAEGTVRFVLVQPRSPGNIGAAARAVKNLGFTRLDLVRPRGDPAAAEARALAAGAVDVLQAARIHDSLDAALAGTGEVIGATRRTGKHRQPHWRIDALAADLIRRPATRDRAVVFGREDHGLSDDELDRCTHVAYLPASDEYGSFNLAQAVLLVGYELHRATLEAADPEPWGPAVTHEEREAMYGHLERALLTIGFLHDESREPIMRRFRRLLGRARMTEDEARMLRGLARQVLWCAGQAGLDAVPSEPDDDDEPSA